MKQLTTAPLTPNTSREQRATVRHLCDHQAVSRPLELADGMSWGAVVQDLSATGVGLLLCYPFKAGTWLAIELQDVAGPRTLLGQVTHATDRSDGTWHIGCELVKQLDPCGPRGEDRTIDSSSAAPRAHATCFHFSSLNR